MNSASNLILVGPTGAGKTTLGARLAAHYALAFLDIDREIERRCGTSVTAIFAREGETGFRAREQAMLQEALAGEGMVLATGGGVVLDAGNRRLLRERGLVVHLHADPASQMQRLIGDDSRPLLAGSDRAQVLGDMAAMRAPLYAEVADLALDTSGLDEAAVLASLVAQLHGRWRHGGAA